jgi:uncharacterized protein (DUF362 family)
MKDLTRREFFKKTIKLSAGVYGLSKLAPWLAHSVTPDYAASNEIFVVRNGSPASMVRKVVEAMGGMTAFVTEGQKVVVKPNIGWDRRPEQAATTNPEVVAEVVKMCREAGASQVTVFDRTCSVARRTYKSSGIEAAASDAGAKVRHVLQKRFVKVDIPEGEALKSWELYKDALEADVLINLPIAKHHSLCKLTMAMKNLMGIMGGNRGAIHNHFPVKITDINTVVKPQLIILDAIRVLLRNGPQGGNLADVAEKNTIIAGTNAIPVDAFGATLFGLNPRDLNFLKVANRRGLGAIDPEKISIKEIML